MYYDSEVHTSSNFDIVRKTTKTLLLHMFSEPTKLLAITDNTSVFFNVIWFQDMMLIRKI